MTAKFILIIEDNASIGDIYSTALSDYDTELILDGKQALVRLKEVVPDLIILDMNLPHVSGHYILKQIRADPRTAEIPVIIATANTPMAEALEPQLTDLDMILIKPISPLDLRDLAAQLMA